MEHGTRPGGATHLGQLNELRLELEDAIMLARMVPGQSMTIVAFARLGRASVRDVEAVLPGLLATGFLRREGGVVIARPLDPQAMLATLPRRIELEIAIVRAAAEKASDAQLRAMQDSEAIQRRCTMLGDIEGMMVAERDLERLLAEASELTIEGEELRVIKLEFRRAWCAVNRLRDFTHVSNIRTALVGAITTRDADAAEAQLRVFYDHLLRSY